MPRVAPLQAGTEHEDVIVVPGLASTHPPLGLASTTSDLKKQGEGKVGGSLVKDARGRCDDYPSPPGCVEVDVIKTSGTLTDDLKVLAFPDHLGVEGIRQASEHGVGGDNLVGQFLAIHEVVATYDLVAGEFLIDDGHELRCGDNDASHGITVSDHDTCKQSVAIINAMCNNSTVQMSQDATNGLTPDHADVETALQASWALVDVAARSLVELAEDVSAPQYRLLVLIDAGVTRGVDLARDLEVHSSTIARMVERLVAKGLIDRSPDPDDRRANVLSLTKRGATLVQNVNEHRRRQLVDLLSHLEPGEIDTVVTGFTLFTRAAEATGHGTPNHSCAEDSSQQ